MASLPPEALAAALSAAHGAGAKSATAAPGGASDPSQDPNAQGGQDPNADPSQGGQDPNSQAVWSEFPSTDPSAAQQAAQQLQGAAPQDIVAMLAQYMQQAEEDQDKLDQMQQAVLSQLVQLMGGPSGGGQDTSAAPAGNPGVGGVTSGY